MTFKPNDRIKIVCAMHLSGVRKGDEGNVLFDSGENNVKVRMDNGLEFDALREELTLLPEKPSALNNQVGGDHYTKYGIHQPWNVFNSWFSKEELKGGFKKDAITYIMRNKNGREDIEKAIHTLQLGLELGVWDDEQ